MRERTCITVFGMGMVRFFVPVRMLALTLGVSTVVLLYLHWRERRKVEQHRLTVSNETAKVLFFPDAHAENGASGLEELVITLNSATSSLDVCVFAISNWKLIDVLISAHQRNIVVRVITDREQMSVNPSPVEKLRRNGIQVRRNNDSYFMHHKFAIIDNSSLINGSLNWTQRAVYGNQENICITSSPDIVGAFLKHFDLLWEQYHPKNYCPSDLN